MGKVLAVKISERGVQSKGKYQYRNDVDGDNYKQVALVLFDLYTFGIPIAKAILEFQKKVGKKNFLWE